MADPYIGEIRIFPYYAFGGQAPMGWLLCNGQILSVQAHQELFAVIQYTYGGDMQQYFAVPNLLGNAPVGVGQGPGLFPYMLGDNVGAASATLNVNQIPFHNHIVSVKIGDGPKMKPANSQFISNPVGADLDIPASRANSTAPFTVYDGFSDSANAQLATGSLATAGSGTTPAHENRQPFLALMFCIAYEGVYPVRS